MAKCSPSRADTILLWKDLSPANTLKECFSQLFSFSKKPNCFIKIFLDNWVSRIFSLPLLTQASEQLNDLLHLFKWTWDPMVNDMWEYNWGSNTFRPKKSYTWLLELNPVSPLFKWMCTATSMGKHKFFFWLLLRDRLNTRNLLRRKNRQLKHYNCVLCNCSYEKTIMHLFFGALLAILAGIQCWFTGMELFSP